MNKRNNIILFSLTVSFFIGLYFLSKLPIKNETVFFEKITLFIEQNPECGKVKNTIVNALADNIISMNEHTTINHQINDCMNMYIRKKEKNKKKETKEEIINKLRKLLEINTQ